jgi:SsrA-binding protein
LEKVSTKTITVNRKAYHEYFIEDSFEAGIELLGTEVKSLRAGSCNLKDSWCDISPGGELFIKQMHIAPYEHGNIFNRDAYRERRLLMHRREINRLKGLVSQQGYTLVPLSMYFKGSKVKVQMGLCKGKKLHDKRSDMAARDAKRDIDRAMKDRQKE